MTSYSTRGQGRKWPKVIIIFAILLALTLVGAVFGVRRVYQNNLLPVNSSQKSLLVTIPIGSTPSEIAKILEDNGVIRVSWAFEWYVRNNDLRDKLQAGTYALRPSQSVQEIVDVLTQGKIATDLVTILPGQRIDQIEKALISYGFSSESVKSALKPENYKNHPALVDKPKKANLEGYLYPESFQKTAETSPEIIIKASLDELQKYLTPDVRAGIVKQGLTVHQGIILASIIEQEVSNPDDKKKVAQVFLRRLKEDIALESDATAGYGAILKGDKPSLSYQSSYNTYLHKGLPPGPISNVSRSSLEAVAKPAKTDYLFFVSGDDGITYFSKTLEEHQRLTREHCTRLCGR